MTENPSPTRPLVAFVATVAIWVIGLFGLFRLPVVQQYFLIPFARMQQGIAVQLFGVSSAAVVVDVSCTGSDAMALAFGAVLGFPAPWKRRLMAVATSFVLISVLNTLRIASVSMVAGDREAFHLLHLHVWPGVIVLGVVLYVFYWMKSVTLDGPIRPAPAGSSSKDSAPTHPAGDAYISLTPARQVEWTKGSGAWGIARSPAWRFGGAAAVLVTGYFAASPWILSSATLQTAAVWSANVARALISGLGVSASVTGNTLIAGDRAWLITPECIVTPLIPVYLATVFCWPSSARRRAVALVLAPPLFFALGIARLLVLALPASLAFHTVAAHAFYQVGLALLLVAFAAKFVTPGLDGRPMWQRGALAFGLGGVAAAAYAALVLAVFRPFSMLIGSALPHLGHGYSDSQGALVILPAFQASLLVALWLAVGERLCSVRMALGLAVLAIQQLGVIVVLGELYAHLGLELPIVAIRALAIFAPVALIWLLRREGGVLAGPLPAAAAARSG